MNWNPARFPSVLSRAVRSVAVTGVVLLVAGCALTNGDARSAGQHPRNIIIMIADGAAATQWDFGRHSSKVLRQQPFVVTDVVFRDGSLGLLNTSPSGPYVTDSAAAASAMSTGRKVANGAVSVTPDGKPLPTVMGIAKSSGKRIGLVTTAAVYW
jgi:alkaline phosphatase